MKLCVKLTLVVALFAAIFMASTPAYAVKPFSDQFNAKYPTLKDKVAKVEGGACNVCHMGNSKKMRNEYGMALNKLLKMADKDNVEKIKMALDTVEKEKAGNGETFGERLKAGNLPTEAVKK